MIDWIFMTCLSPRLSFILHEPFPYLIIFSVMIIRYLVFMIYVPCCVLLIYWLILHDLFITLVIRGTWALVSVSIFCHDYLIFSVHSYVHGKKKKFTEKEYRKKSQVQYKWYFQLNSYKSISCCLSILLPLDIMYIHAIIGRLAPCGLRILPSEVYDTRPKLTPFWCSTRVAMTLRNLFIMITTGSLLLILLQMCHIW